MTKGDMDQAFAGFRDTIPAIWHAVYQGCLRAGFDQGQAFVLTQVYVLSHGSGGVNLPRIDGPKGDEG